MRLNDSHLTFGKIADEWARELKEAETPGRRNRDEIFLEMVSGVWRGQFADTVLTIERAPTDDKDGQRYKPAPMPVTRETLDKMVLLRSGVRPCDPDASRWEFRASLKLEAYEPLSLRAWFEPLTISKDAFGDWCDQCGHERPAFWFPQLSNDHTPPSVDELQLRDQAEKDWYARLVEIGRTQEPNSQNTKEKLFQKAYSEDGLSQRAFDSLWLFAMPTKFKKAGARKTSP